MALGALTLEISDPQGENSLMEADSTEVKGMGPESARL